MSETMILAVCFQLKQLKEQPDHLSMWIDSSVDRALYRYCKAMGSSPVQA